MMRFRLPKLLSSAFHMTLLRARGIECSVAAFFENTSRLKIGEGCLIEAFSVIKGGEGGDSALNIGPFSRVRKNAYISATDGRIDIGKNVLIAHNAWIGGRGSISIGDETLIGPNAVIVSSNHDLSATGIPAKDAPEIRGRIRIGRRCWVGANATVVPNVEIGDGCIVAAGSVVVADVRNHTLVAGNPAKFIRNVLDNEKNPFDY